MKLLYKGDRKNIIYIHYDHNLYSNDNFLLEEVQNSANLNLVPLDIEHPSLSPNASSSFEFRL